jgi:bifunctional non-homologous end joining protein LigD
VVEPPDDEELAALDALGKKGTWSVFGRDLRLTHLDAVMFPGQNGDAPVRKRELVRYAATIAPVVLPYVFRRALTMHRYPDGANGKGHWTRALPKHAPDWMPRWDGHDADSDETRTYLVVDEPAALVWAVNHGALEWHPWASRTDHPDQPTYVYFDIDPGSKTSWEDVLLLARLHRTAFEHLRLQAFPKVTGRRGLHIWVPIRSGPTFDEVRAWAEQVSRSVSAVVPDLVSWKWTKRERGGLARLDYTQNAVAETLVAPYSPRPSAGAPVSVPIEWEELDDPELRPHGWTIRTVQGRLEQRGDPFEKMLSVDQALPRLDP